MKDYLQGLLEQMKTTGTATKAVLLLALLLVAAVIGFATYNAGTPHFRMLYSNLEAHQAAAVQAALAGGNIRFEVSQPPGPYVVHVDDAQYYQAQNLVALAGGLELAPDGIQANQSGAKDVFLSAGERAQNALKREWQEMEKQLEELEFVARAHVSTSVPESSALRRNPPQTVAVTLQLKSGTQLSRGQAATVAKLVRFRFNVPQENVMISDQNGHGVWDGTQESDLAAAANDAFEHKTRYDSELAQRTNEALAHMFGAGLAYVVVNSEWRTERKESIKETIDPSNKAVVSKTEQKSSTPGATSGAGGIAGVEANASGAIGGPNALGNAPAAASQPTTTSDTRQTTIVGRETSHSTDEAPQLERLTVSLSIDESIKDKKDELEKWVKNTLGFTEARDAYSVLVAPFATLKRDDAGKLLPPPAAEKLEEPSRLMEILLQRGVEIAAALVFLFVLLKALKRAPKHLDAGGTEMEADPVAALAAAEEIVDPRLRQMVARRQIEELIRNDPERVSTILSRWAADEERAARN